MFKTLKSSSHLRCPLGCTDLLAGDQHLAQGHNQIHKYSTVEWMTKEVLFLCQACPSCCHLSSWHRYSSNSKARISQRPRMMPCLPSNTTSCILTRCKTSPGLHTCLTNWLQNSSEHLFSPLYYSPDPDFTNSAIFYSHLTITIPQHKILF